MDDAPELPSDDATEGVPGRTEPTGPISDRVRISGADVAGERTGELPVVPRGEVSATSSTGERGDEQAVYLTDEPAAEGPAVGAVDPVGPGQTAVPSTELASPRTRPTPSSRTGRSPRPARCRPCWPATLATSPSRSWGRPGERKTPTGWPTRSSSSRPCSAGSIRPWARSTSRTAPRPNDAPGSSTSRGCGRVTPVRPNPIPARAQRRPSTIEPITEEVPVVSRGVEPAALRRRRCSHRRARRAHRCLRSCFRAGPRRADHGRPGCDRWGRPRPGTR